MSGVVGGTRDASGGRQHGSGIAYRILRPLEADDTKIVSVNLGLCQLWGELILRWCRPGGFGSQVGGVSRKSIISRWTREWEMVAAGAAA